MQRGVKARWLRGPMAISRRSQTQVGSAQGRHYCPRTLWATQRPLLRWRDSQRFLRRQRGRHPLNALTPAFVRNVNQAGRYCDGHGLYLDGRPTGGRGWIQRLAIRGRRTELGLGGFPSFRSKKLVRRRSRTGSWPATGAYPGPRSGGPSRCPPSRTPPGRSGSNCARAGAPPCMRGSGWEGWSATSCLISERCRLRR